MIAICLTIAKPPYGRTINISQQAGYYYIQITNNERLLWLGGIVRYVTDVRVGLFQEGSVTALRNFAAKEQSLQKEILQLSSENMELRFEVEAAKKDIPRLKVTTDWHIYLFIYLFGIWFAVRFYCCLFVCVCLCVCVFFFLECIYFMSFWTIHDKDTVQ